MTNTKNTQKYKSLPLPTLDILILSTFFCKNAIICFYQVLITQNIVNMNTISAIASFFKFSVKWFLPKQNMENVEDHLSALRLSNIFFLCLLSALFSILFSLVLLKSLTLSHLVCTLLLFFGGIMLKYKSNIITASELCILAIFVLSIGLSGISFVHFFWLFSASLLAIMLSGKKKGARQTLILSVFFLSQFIFQDLNLDYFTVVSQDYGPFDFLIAFSLFLGLGFGMNRPKSILIDELLTISNTVCEENEVLNSKLTEKDLIIKSLERELKDMKLSSDRDENNRMTQKFTEDSFVKDLLDELKG